MNLKFQYRTLETRVFSQLRKMIDKSKFKSPHHDSKAIQVNVFDYTELALIHDRLTFVCAKGYTYSVFSDANLEDLIDIINSNK